MLLAILILSITTPSFGELYRDAPFRKCCDDGRRLLKVNGDKNDTFRCVPANYTEHISASTASLIVSHAVTVEFGLPQCDDIVMIDADDNRGSYCSDLLIMEEINGTIEHNIPQVVFLSCASEMNLEPFVYTFAALRKCCPQGQSYDVKFHICKESPSSTVAWLTDNLGDSDVYELEYGLYCKPEEYQIEMSDGLFDLRADGSSLQARRRSDGTSLRFAKGEWCADGGARGLVARGCTRRCRDLGVLCVRKCCPIGQHYRPLRCGGMASTCVPNEDYDTGFNITFYLDGMREFNEDIPETTAIQTGLACEGGKFALNHSSAEDAHRLTRAGLAMPVMYDAPTEAYCLDAFDARACGGGVTVTALLCFVELRPKKDFTISFVAICISCLFLFLTLVVYLALPELRNLHGKTLLCHVATMLLAYCCLARVQYRQVLDKRVCKLLGYGIYFGFVSAFAWLNVMCLDIWWTFGSVRAAQGLRKASSERRRFAWYSLYAWSGSGGLTLLMLLLDTYPLAPELTAHIGRNVCWFSSGQNEPTDWPHYIFFVIPMGAVTCVNFVLWARTARHCHRVRAEVRRLQAGSTGDRLRRRFRDDRARYALTGKLWVVMGAGWVWELLSTLVSRPQWLWVTVDLCNELQGLFIFLILVMKPKLYFLIRKRLGLEKRDARRGAASNTTSTLLSRSVSADDARRVQPADKDKK